MQEDMRLALPPAAPAEVQVDRMHIHVLPHRGSPKDQAASVACHHTPGQPVRLYLEDIKDSIENWKLKPEPAKVKMVEVPPGACDAMLRGLKPAGPIYTVDIVNGRVMVFRDGEPAPADDPWQRMADAQQAEADRVMVRAVSPGHPDPCVAEDMWALDPDAKGHRAPFTPGDLVVETAGCRGIHRVVAVSVDNEAPRHRSLRLTVKRAYPVVDPDAF